MKPARRRYSFIPSKAQAVSIAKTAGAAGVGAVAARAGGYYARRYLGFVQSFAARGPGYAATVDFVTGAALSMLLAGALSKLFKAPAVATGSVMVAGAALASYGPAIMAKAMGMVGAPSPAPGGGYPLPDYAGNVELLPAYAGGIEPTRAMGGVIAGGIEPTRAMGGVIA